METLTGSQAIETVETMCGGSEGFHRVWKFVGDAWEQNLEDFCLQRITPDEYVKRAKEMHKAYRLMEFNNKFEERLVNSRERK